MNTTDLSVFYYAYSTIAQTLAGAFGFLVAATIYRMQPLQEMKTEVQRLRAAAQRLPLEGSEGIPHDEMREQSEMRLGQLDESFSASKKQITDRVHSSLALTVATIITSIILIPLTPLLHAINPYAPWTALILVVGMSVYTIMTYTTIVGDATS